MFIGFLVFFVISIVYTSKRENIALFFFAFKKITTPLFIRDSAIFYSKVYTSYG